MAMAMAIANKLYNKQAIPDCRGLSLGLSKRKKKEPKAGPRSKEQELANSYSLLTYQMGMGWPPLADADLAEAADRAQRCALPPRAKH
jgi:hypothetical protein